MKMALPVWVPSSVRARSSPSSSWSRSAACSTVPALSRRRPRAHDTRLHHPRGVQRARHPRDPRVHWVCMRRGRNRVDVKDPRRRQWFEARVPEINPVSIAALLRRRLPCASRSSTRSRCPGRAFRLLPRRVPSANPVSSAIQVVAPWGSGV